MNDKPATRRGGEKAPKDESGESHARKAADHYEVGYGKPPVATRFVKGQSGNPRGRPRKPKPQPPRLSDAPSDRYLEHEAYRPVALRENGQGIELPSVQAVYRALVMGALKGNRLSQRYFLEHVARQEERNLQLRIQNYARLEALKRRGEEILADREHTGLPPPDLLPHPDDIVLRPATGEAYVNGPETPEEARHYDHAARVRDHCLLRSAHAGAAQGRSGDQDGAVCGHLLLAQFLNQLLPRRYRWQDNAELFLMMQFNGLSRRERERRIVAEFVQLKETAPEPVHVTPDMRAEIDRITRRFDRQPGSKTGRSAWSRSPPPLSMRRCFAHLGSTE